MSNKIFDSRVSFVLNYAYLLMQFAINLRNFVIIRPIFNTFLEKKRDMR